MRAEELTYRGAFCRTKGTGCSGRRAAGTACSGRRACGTRSRCARAELRALLRPGVLDVRADGAGAVPDADDLGVAVGVRAAKVEDALAAPVLALRVPVVAGDTLHVVDAERVVVG
eukprot:31261-Pelagococcus_subviridis.AAC.5